MDWDGGVRDPRTTGPAPRVAVERALERFVHDVPSGARTLVVEGPAGIGKTTLVEQAIERAAGRGFGVAVARIARPEFGLSFAALGDLMARVPDAHLAELPAPQREALEVSLLMAPSRDTAPDPRAVGLAVLNTVRSLTRERPLLVVLDDVQWIDQSSADVISFVLRRLEGEPVGVLAARRTGPEERAGLDFPRIMSPARTSTVELGPFTIEGLAGILRQRLPVELPRTVLVQIHDMVGGNPFFAVEVAQEVLRRGIPEPGAPLPVPADALALVGERVTQLTAQTRAALAVIAATSAPTLELVSRCVPGGDAVEPVAEAERAGLVLFRGDRLAFVHPLFASAVLAQTPAPDLRALHRCIAASVDDPEQRARHLALSVPGPDAEIAEALAGASAGARARGAASSAAELALMAWERTPASDRPHQTERIMEAAVLSFEAGDAARAHQLVQQALDSTPAGPLRAQAMVAATEITWQDTVQVELLASRALEEAGDDTGVAALAHFALAWCFIYRGELERADAECEAGRSLAMELDSPATVADALTVRAVVSCLLGRPYREHLEDAIRLTESAAAVPTNEGGTVYSSAEVMLGLLALWEGDLAQARRALQRELDRYEEQGRYLARDEILCYLALLECRTGHWADALAQSVESLEIGAESGHLRGRGQNIVPRAWAKALMGDLDGARQDATEGLELSAAYRDNISVANNHGVLGFVALSANQPELAAGHLMHVVDFLRESGTVRPRAVPFVPDAVEALVACGRLDEARAVVDDHRLMGRVTPDGPWPGISLRAMALVLAAEGDLGGATECLGQALGTAELAERPFERARTLLVLGEIERRQKQRAEARAHLVAARDLFDDLGAVVWSQRARDALSRVTSSTSPDALLTPTEARLAQLVRDGLTNREAAERLFLSVKTVEANLSRIYRKLQVRSRTELVRLLDGGSVPGLEASRID